MCMCVWSAASGLPHGYQIEALHGFIEELVVNDDPEHQWIDKIRSMRASNEARQMQFSKLSGNFVVNCAMHAMYDSISLVKNVPAATPLMFS